MSPSSRRLGDGIQSSAIDDPTGPSGAGRNPLGSTLAHVLQELILLQPGDTWSPAPCHEPAPRRSSRSAEVPCGCVRKSLEQGLRVPRIRFSKCPLPDPADSGVHRSAALMKRPVDSPLGQPTGSARWTAERVRANRRWTPRRFSFRTTPQAGFRATAGQFARLGLALTSDLFGSVAWRASSMVAATCDEHLACLPIVVPGREFTNRRESLQPGDTVVVDKLGSGLPTADRFAGGSGPWLLSGTGLAHFLSVPDDPQACNDCANLTLVHSVREANELVRNEEVRDRPQHQPLAGGRAPSGHRPVVTREKLPRVGRCADHSADRRWPSGNCCRSPVRCRPLAPDDLRQAANDCRPARWADQSRLPGRPAWQPRGNWPSEITGCERAHRSAHRREERRS